jgi:AbiV family abortive infection protein
MGSSGDWIKDVTPSLEGNMREAAIAAYRNGLSLREDALILFESERYPRTAALAILSEEEFSKAFILLICINQKRWDSNIFKALRKHSEKQGISEGMRQYFELFVSNYKTVMEMNRFSFIQNTPSHDPSPVELERIVSTAKSRFKKPLKDYLKQDAFYINLSKSAEIISTPCKVGKPEAQECLDESFVFQLITEVALGSGSNVQKWAQL